MNAFEMGLKIGSIVKRRGEDNKMYEYEVSDIDADGECITIESDNAYPEWVYIMADDCEIIKL